MSFVKPSTVTNETGAYTYKQSFGSPSANYIDNEFPSALDKTGDTITGEVQVASGGGIVINSGAGIGIQSGANLIVDGGGHIVVESTGAITMQSGSTMTAATSTVTTFSPGAELIFAGADVA